MWVDYNPHEHFYPHKQGQKELASNGSLNIGPLLLDEKTEGYKQRVPLRIKIHMQIVTNALRLDDGGVAMKLFFFPLAFPRGRQLINVRAQQHLVDLRGREQGRWQEEWLEAWVLAKKEGLSQSPNTIQFPQPWASSLGAIFYLHGSLGQVPSFREILRK